MKNKTLSLALFLLLPVLLILPPKEGYTQTLESEQIEQLKFRHIGPIGNRLNSVAGIPGDRLTYYVGAASGGVWKTIDGGLTWKPIFDKQDVHSIGSIAVASSDSEIIYVGTGESFIRSNISIGTGMYKSTDGGESWSHIGLENTGRISRVLIHPTNPDIVFATALGHAYSPQKERGVYKTTDGGTTWNHVLFVDENTGGSDIAMDANNPRILFAGMWQLELKPWQRVSGGPGSAVYMSTDAGENWKKLEGNGLPKGPLGKIALATTPAAPDRVYALIETGDGVPYEGKPTSTGELWRSDNNGKSFKLVNYNRDLGGRQAYYTRCTASPDNPNEIYFMAAAFSRSIDGGKSIAPPEGMNSTPNWDHHEMWIDPLDGDRMAVVGDGGISISQNRGKSWLRNFLPVAQLYHVTTDNQVPYNVYTNRQDGPSMMGPSNTRVAGFFGPGMIQSGAWRDVGGGESGFATPDPVDPNIVWSSASGRGPLGGIVTRYNASTNQYRQLEVWPEFPAGHPAENLKYRFQWTFPLHISAHDNNTVYVTSQHVHKTTNKGQTWQEVSPDLTLNDKSMQGFSGGLTGDNIAVEYANVIYAFDESPVQKGVLWAGTNDGLVQVSQDDGATWTNVTKNIPGLPELGIIRNIDASKWEVGKAYITVDFHMTGDFEPYVYKTSNFGRSWTKITKGIAEGKLSYARCVREDPVKKGLIYLGTENALYFSMDDGMNWQPLKSNMPATPMYWIDIPEHYNDMVIATYGRGIWILDDITPLQQLTTDITTADAHLFSPKSAYRFQSVTSTMQLFPEASSGQNPSYGASLHYWMKEVSDTVKVNIHITNNQGDTIRTLKQKPKSGINRVIWDFKGKPTTQILMRTHPQYAEWMPLDKKRTRKSTVGPFSVLSPPGRYTIHLSVDTMSYTQRLQVVKDPYSEGSTSDIQAQTKMMNDLHADMNTVAEHINEIEIIRRQLLDLKSMIGATKKDLKLVADLDTVHTAFLDVENKMTQLMYTGTGQDAVRYPARLAERIQYLAQTVPISDFAPADAYVEVHTLLKSRLAAAGEELEELKTSKLAQLMSKLSAAGIGTIISDW